MPKFMKFIFEVSIFSVQCYDMKADIFHLLKSIIHKLTYFVIWIEKLTSYDIIKYNFLDLGNQEIQMARNTIWKMTFGHMFEFSVIQTLLKICHIEKKSIHCFWGSLGIAPYIWYWLNGQECKWKKSNYMTVLLFYEDKKEKNSISLLSWLSLTKGIISSKKFEEKEWGLQQRNLLGFICISFCKLCNTCTKYQIYITTS